METTLASAPVAVSNIKAAQGWRALWQEHHADQVALGLALCSVPLSIAVTEMFLGVALLARIVRLIRGEVRVRLPRVFWYWLPFAGWVTVRWMFSPDLAAGRSEIRHLVLIGCLFLVLPAIGSATDRLRVWKGVFLAATLSSLFLIADFTSRFFYYRRELRAGGDPGLYLRSGGLLNHWMVYGTIEILVFAGLLSFWQIFPEKRWRWLPVVVINGVAMVLSLTRMVWLTCLVLLVLDLVWRRSRWLLAIGALPALLYLFAPATVRSRVRVSMQPGYYSNAERLEMLQVGRKMLRAHPLAGVGPGQIGKFYRSYLSPGDPIPAYYDHLHNNLVELAAEFGFPILLAGAALLGGLIADLARALQKATDRESLFLCRTGILALTGFLLAGCVEYTYGHSLGLILLGFATLSPAFPTPSSSQAESVLQPSPVEAR